MARIQKLDYISGSSIDDYLDDRLRWCYKWVENRVPRHVPSALKIGKLIHSAFETHFKTGLPVDMALANLLPEEGAILDPREQKDVDLARGMIEPLAFWKDQFPIEETLEVEQPFEFYLTSGAKFRGRPDRVVKAYGKAFHMQHKTMAAGVKPDVFVMLMSEKMHELLYAYYLRKKYAKHGLEYGGTIANIIRKLKYRSKQVTKAEPLGKILHTPEEMLFQNAVPISWESVEQAYTDANGLSVLMDRTVEMYLSGKRIERNRRLDGGLHGNAIDPYTLVAIGEIDLADDTFFMDREETYEMEETSDEA